MLRMKVEKRIDQYLKILESRCYEELGDLDFEHAVTQGSTGENVYQGQYEPISFPFPYERPWSDHWFCSTATLHTTKDELFLLLDTETDTMVYINGKVYAATNPFHKKVRVTEFSGQRVTIHLEAWGGHLFPGYHPDEGGRVQACVAIKKSSYPLVFKQPKVLRRNESVYGLYYDVLVLRQLSKTLDPNSFHYQQLVSRLAEAISILPLAPQDSESFSRLATGVREKLRPLLEANNGTYTPQVLSVGSAHLDHAWLWPIAETTRKAARTALNMTRFLEEYPSFRFMFSQPAQMEELREHYPTVYQRVQKAYKEGRWEPNGVCYIEPDCMLPSGESLIRQCLVGRKANEAMFPNYQADVFWLPDSFGYTAALPQILVGCGVKYFVTSKLSWNDTNRFPYDLFLWESLDGTKIKSHMLQGAYEGTNDPVGLCNAYDTVLHKEIQPILLRSVGEGDGGGGTLRSDLELMEREADLQGLPKNRWSSVSFAMGEIFPDDSILPTYKGELYLELHRGTYTSQAKLKQWNRRFEGLLRCSEYLVAHRFVQGKDVTDELSILTSVWKQVLINQFHDILPGSAIRKVNEEAEHSYEKAYAQLLPLLGDGEGRYILNANEFAIPLDDGTLLPSLETTPMLEPSGKREIETKQFATDWATVSIDGEGGISSILLKENGRQLVEEGKLFNHVSMGEDYPVFWDAWDIEADTLEKQQRIGKCLSMLAEEDAVSFSINQMFKVGLASSLTQQVIIYKHQSRIDFKSEVDWHERHQLLRVSFPTTLRCDQALYDVPFGYIKRDTHTNTSYQLARFEVPAHQFVALQDASLTLALASDCKYGYHAQGGELSLSLLRSPTAPDPEADQGRHTFCYSMICSTTGLRSVQEHASVLNNPPVKVSHRFPPLVEVTGGSVAVSCIKVSEDGTSLVFRLREYSGSTASVKLSFSPDLDAMSLIRTSMVEIPTDDEKKFTFRPFEVKTYRMDRVHNSAK